ncbi:MAG: acetyl-CoA carboxylase biotin carboxyl carrier protein subunit [Bacteroidetes bacterium]|nr:MAG: acetyl-CoA carboxylase biotin carboxyl carrier protein subunit [Bacteroidota bacterium]
MTEKTKPTRFSSLNVDGVKYRTLLTKSFKSRKKYEEKDPNKILAVIPGTIVEILTKKGKKVNEGEVLLILEAMKMRNAVVAPHDGTVAKILVKESDIVTKGKLIIEMG